MEAADFSEALVHIHQTTRRHVPEDSNVSTYRFKERKISAGWGWGPDRNVDVYLCSYIYEALLRGNVVETYQWEVTIRHCDFK
jgi:hypothetical protein